MKLLTLSIASIALSVSCVSYAGDKEVAALSGLLSGLSSYSAGFKQTLKDDDGEVIERSSGQMAVVNTGKIRWQTEQPFSQLVVTDGIKLWRYDADLEQATVGPFDVDLSKTPAMILSGKVGQLNEQYQVDGGVNAVGTGSFTLKPRSTDSLFDKLVIDFEGREVTGMTLQDGFEQSTVIRFNGIKLNPKLADSMFVFVPPKGTDVLEDN
ncbi:outer membrane lipoprotein carrier protein [Sinobacterium caligoides]|uniref:Outer-membrane lipoprotein carrier protein n=1 Tax=Sinobacterium caligoides TaxID=933926 RepID=A0A3N2DXM3_9GAMM|nr:outer membrane lipoprotein chaperone LolA [Sinobacterium caligoides]ROS04558.1 outer membrane lipoprotein carrier protein [Sinobacterium caligoides]